ncbi:hypothetical protein EBR25_11015 [bacterium]|nr:hypothetical protein [bacterium]
MSKHAYEQLSSGSNKMFVVVAGNIGSGKTTLTKKLSERLSWFASVRISQWVSCVFNKRSFRDSI